MKLPEKPPVVDYESGLEVINDMDAHELLNEVHREYYPWDKVKYLDIPFQYTKEQFWSALKLKRASESQFVTIGGYLFSFGLPINIQKGLHEFDIKYGASIGSTGTFNSADTQQYLISSIMEEAITSSQIEGAITSRKVAKEMLLQNRTPKNKSEKMIRNNYLTIQKIREMKDKPLTKERLLEVQKLMTSETLDNPEDEGRFRTDNEVRVVDSTDGTVMHQPPPMEELDTLMDDICIFFNEDKEAQFIHPIIKACILHFLIGFIHPFVDGNGRTARALFYWYMLKKGYWLTEYLSISAAILKSKVAYGKAYLYTETDDLDLTYFLTYKMKVIHTAYESLQKYLERKMKEKEAAALFMRKGGINERQAQILQWVGEEPSKIILVKEVETAFGVANETARKDLRALVVLKLLESKRVNKQKEVFVRRADFDKQIKALK